MAHTIVYPSKTRVALKEDTSVRGVVMTIVDPYELDGCVLYQVRWDKFGQDYGYLADALILEKDVK